MVDGSVGWMVDWLVGWLVSWMDGWLDGWVVGWLVGRLVGYPVHAPPEALVDAVLFDQGHSLRLSRFVRMALMQNFDRCVCLCRIVVVSNTGSDSVYVFWPGPRLSSRTPAHPPIYTHTHTHTHTSTHTHSDPSAVEQKGFVTLFIQLVAQIPRLVMA